MHILRVAVCFLLAAALQCGRQPADVRVEKLRCEYHSQPLGLDISQPRLSWNLVSHERGVVQTGYRILVASTAERLSKNLGDLWDSGHVVDHRTLHIVYAGRPLESRQPAFWKVMVWDQENRPSAWSAPASWEMGLLNGSDWQAQWIGAPQKAPAAESATPLFRKNFTLTDSLVQARLYISGLGYYEASLNGKKISDHVLTPNQSNYDQRKQPTAAEPNVPAMSTTVYYETFDVTDLVAPGANVLGVILGNGWYFQRDRLEDTNIWHDTPRLLAQLEILYSNGRRQTIASDKTWKTSDSPILHNGLHTGEIYDSRKEQPWWDQQPFDDSSWRQANTVRPPTGVVKAQIYPADRVIKTLPAKTCISPEPGVQQFDLGQMISGWVRLKIKGPAGAAVKLRFIEELGPSYGQTDTYILNGKGLEIWEPRFTWHAFRYVQVLDAPQPLALDAVEGRVVNTDVDTVGSFTCSNALFNRILENYRWTQLGNMHGGVPSDCPHRERRGYTGDGQISARAAIYQFDMTLFYSKWLRDVFDAQNRGTGYVPNTAPYQGGGGGTAWGSACVMIPWYMYLYYGDVRILQDRYDEMQHWVNFLKSQLNRDGLLAGQGLGEWVPPDICEIPEPFVNSCYYFHNLDLMSRIARVLERSSDEIQYADEAERIRRKIHEHFLNADGCSYSIDRQGANVFPLGLAITPDSLVQPVEAHLIDRLLTTQQGHFDTGILATPLLLEVLTTAGRSDLAYTLMNHRDYPSYGYMISKGATTIWETWMGDQSHSHPMFGSVCQWFYESLAGIAPDPNQPGFRHLRMQPRPVLGLDFVRASYNAATGFIRSDWQLDQNDFVWSIELPANTSATVLVPAQSVNQVTESNKPIGSTAGVRFREMQQGYAVVEIGSGEYRFKSAGAAALFRRPMAAAPIITPGDTLIEKPNKAIIQIQQATAGEGDAIHYTLDGSEPDVHSTVYTAPFSVDHTLVVKAKTFQQGTAGFSRTQLVQFVDPAVNGLRYRLFYGNWQKLPDLERLQAAASGLVYRFALEDVVSRDDLFALSYQGRLRIDRPGTYTFYLLSNDGSRLYLNDRLVVDNDGQHGAEERSGKITLTAGLHPLRVDYFQAGGGMLLKVSYDGPELSKREIPADALRQ